jgi:hypothetical protein
MNTDTPRTDAVIQSPNSFFMVRVENLCRELERELKNAQEAYLKSVERDDYLTQELAASQAEVERLDHLLADASETNHKLGVEVERLKILLSDLLTLTEKNYWNSHNYNQIKEAINQTDK